MTPEPREIVNTKAAPDCSPVFVPGGVAWQGLGDSPARAPHLWGRTLSDATPTACLRVRPLFPDLNVVRPSPARSGGWTWPVVAAGAAAEASAASFHEVFA